MKRGEPPKRKKALKRTALKRPTLEQVREYEAKHRAKRKPIPKLGKKARREKDALDVFRAEVKRRAIGRCQAPLSAFVGDRRVVIPHAHVREPHDGAHAHHLFPEDRAAGRHDPARGIYLCWAAHDWIHHGSPADAHALGLLRPEE